MKKFSILMAVLAFIITNANAQSDTTKYYYSQMTVKGNISSAKISIDFGGDTFYSYPVKERKVLSDKIESLSSMVDAMNYMNSKEWQYVETYLLPTSIGVGVHALQIYRIKK
jgi:hypothetical protein